MQIVEVRRALEAEVAELAAAMKTSPPSMPPYSTLPTPRACRDGVEEDVLFHSAIAQAAGNAFMISTLGYLAQFLKGATRVTRANEARRADFANAVTHEHTHIVCAIEAGDPLAARAAAA